ncbi:hypothetical protein J3R30DRAFT_3655257 [Lentinula aciculospora]|uniref:WW domain-containing protein n=1 Tax=Lentinula aciculospora TaxID=153920 RepID=A0A9W9ANJ1_9AGAR|nr:hypothetical protein J3R30DRAFT_3655257 [Lentinula aciculospora]
MSSTSIHNLPLPYGWIEQRHESGHPYYVDTKANPPRSIWTHPYEDEQYLHEYPDAREKVKRSSNQEFGSSHSGLQQPLDDRGTRRHSYNGVEQSSIAAAGHKRGFFGKLKDKAIGTKEAREAEKARTAQLQEQRRQQRLAQQQAYYSQAQYAPAPQQYGSRYGGYGGGYGSGMGGMTSGRRTGGMGGMALPLIGGMAGGLLLGEVLDGGFGGGGFDNGGFGGGGFDNGGFGGGGFDNGGFDGGGFDGGGFDNMGGGF